MTSRMAYPCTFVRGKRESLVDANGERIAEFLAKEGDPEFANANAKAVVRILDASQNARDYLAKRLMKIRDRLGSSSPMRDADRKALLKEQSKVMSLIQRLATHED